MWTLGGCIEQAHAATVSWQHVQLSGVFHVLKLKSAREFTQWRQSVVSESYAPLARSLIEHMWIPAVVNKLTHQARPEPVAECVSHRRFARMYLFLKLVRELVLLTRLYCQDTQH